MARNTTEQKILEATIECIEKEGIDGCTIRKIAEIAGVNSAAINYYFRSKGQLIRQALNLTLENAFDWKDFISSQGVPPAERIEKIVTDLLRGSLRFPGISRAHFHPILNQGNYDIPAVRALNHFLEELKADLSRKGVRLPDTELRQVIVQIVCASLIPTIFIPKMFVQFANIDFSKPETLSDYMKSLSQKLLSHADGRTGDLVVREADPKSEMHSVRALFEEYIKELDEDLSFQGFDEELQNLPGEYRQPEGSLYLAFLDNMPVGCIAMRRIDAEACEMKRLFVEPQYRHRKIGEMLVRCIIISARAHGYTTMKLDSLRRLKAAAHLYEKFGFHKTTPYVYNPLPEAVYMELEL